MLKTKFGTKLFSLLLVLVCVFALVGCQQGANPSAQAIADAEAQAQEIHDQLIWDKTAMSLVTANVKGFITKTKYQNVTVAWESSAEDVLDTKGNVNLPGYQDPRAVVVQEATEDAEAVKAVPVTMTATITAVAEWEIEGKEYSKTIKLEKEFVFTIATLASDIHVGTIAEVKAAAAKYVYDEQGVQRELVSNSSVTYNAGVTATVTAILMANGSGQFMIHDGTEGIYVYSTLEGLKVGDKVTVSGKIYSYYGALQFGADINVTVVEEGAGLDAEYRATTPQELEEEGAARNDKGLVKAGYYGGELVNVYGKLVAEAATGGSSDKYHVADAKTGEKLWIYYKSYNADMEAKLQQYVGKYVNLRGVTYDRDSRLQKNEILWDGTIEEAEAPTLTDADKVAVELAGVSVPAEADADFDLKVGEGYVWEVVSGSAIKVEGGKALVTRGEADDTVTLKLTVTIGSASDSKEYEVKVPAAKLNIITIAEAKVLGGTTKNEYTADKYYIQGTVIEIQNTTYGNIVIEDATGSILVYGTYSKDGSVRYDKLENAPQVGDIVTMYGILGYYNDSQMKNGWLVEHYDVVTVAEAKVLGGTEKNKYTETKYALTGKVVEIQNATYGNIVIEDATGSILVYGTYSADGKDRFDALAVKPAVGQVITVWGILGYYNDSQMKNGWILSIAEGSEDVPHEHEYVNGKCECGEEDPNYVPEAPSASKLVLTADNLGLSAYAAGTATVGGIELAYTELGSYGDGIQWRQKNGNVSSLWNTTPLAGKIAKIEIVYTEAKATYSNANALKIEFGTDATVASYSTFMSTENGVTLYTITPDAETYDFVKFTINITYSMYFQSITIHYAGASEAPHEHEFVEGKCECGEEDPNYVPTVQEVTCAEAATLADGTQVVLKGTVHEVNGEWDSNWNNMNVTIKDATGTFYLYRLSTKVQLGDIVTVTGVIGSYNEAKQLAQGGTAEITGHDESYDKAPEESGATLSFANKNNRTAFDTAHQVWEENGIKVTNNKGASTSNVADYANPARFYKSSELIVEKAGMTSITFVCNSSSYATALKSAITAADGVTVSVDGSKVIVTFATAVDSYTIASLTGGQVRMNSIEVK